MIKFAWILLLAPSHTWLSCYSHVAASNIEVAINSISSILLSEAEAEDTDKNDLTPKQQTFDEEKSRRHLLHVCEGPTKTHYFEVSISLAPGSGTGMCNVADQIFLGNDINQILLRNEIGDSGTNDDFIFQAEVCTKPTSKSGRQLMSLRSGAFIWNGGGGCRYCLVDDIDRRGLRVLQTSNWFTDTFAPQMTASLEAEILNTIVPNHIDCLGQNPVIDVDLIEVSLSDLNLQCDANGRVMESLQALSLDDVALQTKFCKECVSLDFSKYQGKDNLYVELKKGDYVRQQFEVQYGLSIMARGGFSPDGLAYWTLEIQPASTRMVVENLVAPTRSVKKED